MLLTTALLVFSAATSAKAAEGPPADPAAAFRIAACSTAAAAGWDAFEDAWLRARVPKGWTVLDRAGLAETAASTGSFIRLSVYLDGSRRSSSVPKLLLSEARVDGKAPADGAWLAESLADARSRGELALGTAGAVGVPGRGACSLGVVERDARGACSDDPTLFCRSAVLHLDCGVKGGVQLLVVATTPAYPARGKPEGKAAEALAQIKSFLCTLEYRK